MPATPAVVLNGRLDILAANALGRALFSPVVRDPAGDPPTTPGSSSSTRSATTFFREWDNVANDTVALLRAEAGRNPYDRDLSDLVGELSTRSDDFRVRWAAHDVRIHTTGIKKLPPPGRRRPRPALRVPPLAPAPAPAWSPTSPSPDSPAQDALALLASWAASDNRSPQHQATPPAPPPLS